MRVNAENVGNRNTVVGLYEYFELVDGFRSQLLEHPTATPYISSSALVLVLALALPRKSELNRLKSDRAA